MLKRLMMGDWIVLGLIALAVLWVIVGQTGGTNTEAPPDSAIEADADIPYDVAEIGSGHTSESAPPPPGALMDERERALYEADPSSMGYTEEDRAFLRENGVSEAEARAVESAIGNPD